MSFPSSPPLTLVSGFPCFTLPVLLSSSLLSFIFSLYRQKDTASQCLPVRLLGPLAGKVLEFSGVPARLAPKIPHLSTQTQGAASRPYGHRPGWTGFRSLITTRKLKKGNNCFKHLTKGNLTSQVCKFVVRADYKGEPVLPSLCLICKPEPPPPICIIGPHGLRINVASALEVYLSRVHSKKS